MVKRAALWALGVVAVLVLWQVLFGQADADENALVPPAAELWVAALYLVLVAVLTFAVAYAVQWRRQRGSASRS